MTVKPPASRPPAAPTVVERVAGGVIGFVFGNILGSLAGTLFATTELGTLLIVVSTVAGIAYGVLRPPSFVRERQALPVAVAGEPAPIGSLGAAAARDVEGTMPIAMLVGAAVALGPVLVGYALVANFGVRFSLTALGIVSIVGFVAAIGIVAGLPPFLLQGEKRAAFVANTWIGAREYLRAFGSRHEVADMPRTPDAVARWVAGHPETDANREVHAELHLMARDWDAARATIGRIPAATPRERFTKRLLEAMLTYQTTGAADDVSVRAAADEVADPDDGREARVALAVFDARRMLPEGDWRRPLAEARTLIQESDVTVLLRDFAAVTFGLLMRRAWPIVALLLAIVLVLGLTVDGVL